MEDIHREEFGEATNEHLKMHERVELLEKEVAFLDRENAELWQIIIDNDLLPPAPNPIPVPSEDAEVITNDHDLIDYVDDDAEFIN